MELNGDQARRLARLLISDRRAGELAALLVTSDQARELARRLLGADDPDSDRAPNPSSPT